MTNEVTGRTGNLLLHRVLLLISKYSRNMVFATGRRVNRVDRAARALRGARGDEDGASDERIEEGEFDHGMWWSDARRVEV